MLAVGDRPADFTLFDQSGQPVPWSSLRGAPVVLFFYPKADTPGCTQEACDFRDLRAEADALGLRLIGVSADPVARQASFARKHQLELTLLSDPDHAVLEPWGIWGEKSMYGRTTQGIHRTTLLFDADGVVRRVWTKVKVNGHAAEVLAAARALT